jgi:predicted permease
MNAVLSNVRYALRKLSRTPGFTAVSIVSLALGIGATSAIYSLFDQIMLRELPVAQPERLANLAAPGPKPGQNTCNSAGGCHEVFSYPMFRDLERAQQPFAGIAAHRYISAYVSTGDRPRPGGAMLVSGAYFPLLGVPPALGRLLGPEDDRRVGGHPVAVLSHAFWQTQLGGDRSVVGKSVVVNGYSLAIVGVAPRGFHGTTLGLRPEVFVPIRMRGLVNPGWEGFDDRRSYWAYVFGRLKPGVTAEQAERSLNVAYRGIISEVEVPLQTRITPDELARFQTKRIEVTDGARGQSTLHVYAATPLRLFLGITGLVLLIACANLANLLLARGARRGQEVAIRRSLGATRPRLFAQFITEAWLLAFFGGVVSLAVAWWTLSLIGSFLPDEVGAALDLGIRFPVLAFTALLSLGTGVLFGIYPAVQGTRADLVGALKSGSASPAGARATGRFRAVLVTGQIALSLMLLVSAGLFVKSLVRVSRVDLGFRVGELATFALNPRLNGYSQERSRALFDQVEKEAAALPGVVSVSSAFSPVLAEGGWGSSVSVEGFQGGSEAQMYASRNEVGTGFFRTLGVPLAAGREFTDADGIDAPLVAIVNEAFTRKFGLGRAAVGKRMARKLDSGDFDIEIVGVVPDARFNGVKDEARPMFFTPWRQSASLAGLTFYVRGSLPPEQVIPALPGVVHRLDANLPVDQLETMSAQVREVVSLDRVIGTLAAAFAVLATLLAALGLYGVMAYSVAQRTREIGIRMAVGAEGSQIRWMVVRQVARMTVAGSAIGLVLALGLGRAAKSLLFEIQAHDPQVVGGGVVLLALVALGAAYLPARRASRVDPIVALKAE